MNLFNLIFMLLGVVIGSFLTLFALSLLECYRNKKIQDSLDSLFKEVLSNITNGSSKFISRVNNIVNIEMNLESQGSVNIMYWLNSKDVSIFKGENCIYTSNNVNQDIMKKISANILLNYNESINNTVIVLDTIFDKDTFSRLTGVDIDTAIIMDDITPTQLPDPSLDEILDRINIVGYDNLSDFEKKLLKKYGSSK
jgi:hypothetical protein